jgi:hypothetical protein
MLGLADFLIVLVPAPAEILGLTKPPMQRRPLLQMVLWQKAVGSYRVHQAPFPVAIKRLGLGILKTPAETGMGLVNLVAVVTMFILIVVVVLQGRMGMVVVGVRHIQGAEGVLTEDLQALARLGATIV